MSGNRLDERQNKIMGGAQAISAIFILVYKLVIIAIKFYGNKTFAGAYVDIGLIVVMIFIGSSYYIASNRHDKSIEEGKIKKNIWPIRIDERQRELIRVSLGISTAVAYIYLIISILFRFLKARNFSQSYLDIGLIAILSIIVAFYHLKNKEYSLTSGIGSKLFPTGKTKEEKKKRYLKYAYTSFTTSLILIPIDIYSNKTTLLFETNSRLLTYGLNTMLRFITLFVLNYLWGEYNVRKHNRFNSLLDDDLD